MMDDYDILHLGGQGDGVAILDGEEVHIPFALPGERVQARQEGSQFFLEKIIDPAAGRVRPECKYFTRCGGCKLQHLVHNDYLVWKSEKVKLALSRRGIEFKPEPVWFSGFGARRRAVFSATRTKKSVVFGFHRYRSDVVENIECCPVLHEDIAGRLGELADLSAPFLTRKKQARVRVTACVEGLDVLIDGARQELSRDVIESASALCAKAGVQRLEVAGEPLYQRGVPEIELSGVRVPLPPGAFLQATENAEERMSAIVADALSACKNVIDLFSGIGTFSFPLAKTSHVLAVENSHAALDALIRGADGAKGLKPISVLNRDLVEDPLSARELNEFDGLVFDPPRAGAIEQARQIAKSDVPRVVAVSCNPSTHGRDLRCLIDGGYRLTRVYPIDQFVYSPHIEVVAVLERA